MSASETQPGVRRLLIVNQQAGPLMVELLSDLSAAGVDCALLAGRVDAPRPEELPFRWLRAKPLRKSPAWRRIWTWGTFTLQALLCMVRNGRHGGFVLSLSKGRRSPPCLHRRLGVMVSTNPPLTMLAMPLLKRLLGIRYVLLIYDIYPDVMERMGMIRRDGLAARAWRRLSRRAMLAADAVITLGPHMADTLRGHLRPGDKLDISVLPNWADTNAIRPVGRQENPFAREHALADKFVVTYSGAFGATHDVESIITAAASLQDLSDVHFMLIGGGTRQREVSEQVAAARLPNLTLLPFQPVEMLTFSLTAADCLIVCLDEGYEGISVPSKTYYALAAGAALLAVSPPNTELTDLVAQHGCGIHIPPRSPAAIAEAVRRLHGDRTMLAEMKRRSVAAAEESFSRQKITSDYQQLLNRTIWRS